MNRKTTAGCTSTVLQIWMGTNGNLRTWTKLNYLINKIFSIMKKIKILYWVFTGMFAAFMLLSAIPDIFSVKEAIEQFSKMSMPVYLLPFLGIAKALGVLARLIPGYPRIKEWAYAGLVFDLLGATWCVFSSGERGGNLVFMSIPIATAFLSYAYYHKRSEKRSVVVTPV